MCLVSSEPKQRYVVREHDDHHAPRPVSNYHGGPPSRRTSATHARRSTSSVPPQRERVSYRSSYRSSAPRMSRDYVSTDVRRTSRTYVR